MGWKITDWKEIEPPTRTDRKSEGSLRWWKCPVTQNRRYKWLIKQRGGWKLLGIWHALVSYWGRQTKKSRDEGVLRTVASGDKPATLAELSADSLVPKKALAAAIPRFLEIGWLAEVEPDDIPSDIPEVCLDITPEDHQLASETRLEETRLEETRTNKRRWGPCVLGFDEFWKLYPKKQDKLEAEKKWIKLNPDAALRATIMTALADQITWEAWENPRWVPQPTKWLKGELWENEKPKENSQSRKPSNLYREPGKTYEGIAEEVDV